jgi:NADP-dependent 3-hydroxy acid dehydrogenase YdfG
VVITGASKGIGESTARLPARKRARVVLGARRKEPGDALFNDIISEERSALGLKTDVTRRGDVEALVKTAIDRHGRIDVVVNNSGIMPIAPIAALNVEEWDRMIDVNIHGVLYRLAAILPIMQKQKPGHVINIYSKQPYRVHYAARKC